MSEEANVADAGHDLTLRVGSFEGPFDLPDTGDREQDVRAFMQEMNDQLERWVRRHPEQWYWLHRRWKTRPPEAARAAAAAPAPGDPPPAN